MDEAKQIRVRYLELLTLYPGDHSGSCVSGPWAPLPQQLQVYLDELEGCPALSRPATCNPYEEAEMSVEESTRTAEEPFRLGVLVTARPLPPPPNSISSSPGEPADEEFGWDGSSEFCDSLSSVLDQSISAVLGVVAEGD